MRESATHSVDTYEGGQYRVYRVYDIDVPFLNSHLNSFHHVKSEGWNRRGFGYFRVNVRPVIFRLFWQNML
jgi:hypothetical protein